jgi:hypothetical protein
MALGDWVDRFAVWDGFHPDLQTLLIYGVGIALYTALVFAFYQNISVRDPLHSRRGKRWWARTVHVGETILTFPILSFGYFAVLSLALFVMAKPDRATADILLLSMACVIGIRVTAHLAEGMSNDIAKLLPLGLLAVIVVDPGYLTFTSIVTRLGDSARMVHVLVQYFALFIVVEAAMRGLRRIAPGLSTLAHRIQHKRHLSKDAMLRDVESEHGGHSLFHRAHHEHAPRDRARDFLALDEHSGGKPGSRQGAGPALPREARHGREAASAAGAFRHASSAAIKHEMKHAARAEQHAHRPTPKAGPGGSGGKLGSS